MPSIILTEEIRKKVVELILTANRGRNWKTPPVGDKIWLGEVAGASRWVFHRQDLGRPDVLLTKSYADDTHLEDEFTLWLKEFYPEAFL